MGFIGAVISTLCKAVMKSELCYINTTCNNIKHGGETISLKAKQTLTGKGDTKQKPERRHTLRLCFDNH